MHNYYVADSDQITPTTLLLTLQKEDSDKPLSFQPGQYAAISFIHKRRPTTNRCFSIVSSPTDQDILQFSMRTKGRFTRALQSLRKGDHVVVRGPYGGFVFDAGKHQQAVFLAGGIGIAPFMSMINFATTTNLDNKVDLLYSCQTQDDVPFAEDIIKASGANKNLRTTFVIGEGPTSKFAGKTIAEGRITPELLDKTIDRKYQQKTFFICGPPPFMKGMVAILKSKGVAKDKIITEAFSQGPHQQSGKIRSWPMNMYILSGLGLVGASFTFMATDLIKSLPPTFLGNKVDSLDQIGTVSSRQKDLDALVNSLENVNSDSPESAAARKALKASLASKKKAAATAASPSTSTSSSSSGQSSSGTSSTTKTTTKPKVTAPKPTTPKCTTTQSGVTTCQ